MRPLCMALAAALLFTPAAHAQNDLTVEGVVELAKTEEWFQDFLQSKFDGISWAQSYYKVRGTDPLFCQPGKLVLNGSALGEMLGRYIKETPAEGERSANQVGLVLIKAAQYTFPCDE